MPHYDVIVLGTGGVGSSAAFHLARRGHRVLGLDRFPGGHDRGSSHGQTRIIRQAYFEHPDYVPLLRRAYELWRDLEQHVGQSLFRQVGLLQAGPPGGTVVGGVLASARQHGLNVDEMSATACRQRFPGFQVPDSFAAVFEPIAGFLWVESCVLAHLRAAREAGAELVTGESVQGWRREGQSLVVETDRNQYRAARLVITAGAWAGQLLRELRVPFRVLRKHLHWYACDEAAYQADQGCPTFFFETPDGCYYGFPSVDQQGVKAAEHTGGTEIQEPLHDERSMEELDRCRVAQFLKTYMPGVSSRPTQHGVCYYTMSPDHHFVVDQYPGNPAVTFAAGLSGHGFKFASVLGELLADLALDGSSRLPADFLGLGRFRTANGD